MLTVYFGLLECQIINGKGRDIIEFTSLKKMRELIERKFGSWDLSSSALPQDLNQMANWLLHQVLVYAFTNKDLTNQGIFATLLTDSAAYGNIFIKAVQMNPSYLLRYMVASFLLAQG
mmetsp:Transcript_6922/g.11656  ORF Transcript_6922/g.11656 Transcript_6922/m.11656 type:complete len:118 (-) Transcript_6922:624-977(-)